MTESSKVLWGEGLFLRPQHFQRQDEYHENRLHQTASALHPYHWGLLDLDIDRAALANGTLRINRLRMIFRDGEIYDAPFQDELPALINVEVMPASSARVYCAALPILKKFGANCSDASQNTSVNPSLASRYTQESRPTPDLFTNAASADLVYMNKAVRVLPEEDARDSLVFMPLLRIIRDSQGNLECDPDFMPPCAAISASPPLLRQLKNTLEKLSAKIAALYGHHREPSRNVIEFRSGDIASFWLLHTANQAHAILSHYRAHPALHPERLFEQLRALTGSLLTFSRAHSIDSLPDYQHHNPGPGFAILDNIIYDMLDTVISARYFGITLNETRPSHQTGKLDSGMITEQTALYLAVTSTTPLNELVSVVPARFKVGSPEDVDKFVMSALPGVRLQYMPQVPPDLPVRPNACYFLLEGRDAMYARMLQSQSICIYTASGVADLNLELIAVNP